MKKIILILLISLSIILFTCVSKVEASTPYKTYTVNRYNELIETQEAYTPLISKNITYDSLSIKQADDMIFDEDNYLYIADTGNARVLILDSDLNVIKSFGEGFLTNPRGIYVLDNYIYVTDYDTKTLTGRILIYEYDKGLNNVTLYKEYFSPTSWILEVDGYIYKPLKIAVSENKYMYVTSEGSTQGLLMIDPDNNFITYFASNTPKYTFKDKVMYFLFEGTKWADRNKKIASAPYNVMLGNDGYVYTVTKGELDSDGYTDNFKKVNTGGVNFYPTQMIGTTDFVDSYQGKYSNTYCISSTGKIYEYDNEGNLLFQFAGKGDNLDVYGLFSSASTIAVDNKDQIYVIDNQRNNLQIFRPTTYCEYVHKALSLYKDAKYEEALEIWQEVLRYNSMFDLAHKGVGLAYYMSGEYEKALDEFYIAYDKADYSEAFWEIRNIYLIDNLSKIITIIFIISLILLLIGILNKRYHFLKYVFYPFIKLYEIEKVKQILYSYRYMKHPSDSIYETKVNNRATVLSSTFILVFIFVIYILGMVYNGFIFNDVIIEKTILLTEGIKIVIPIILFIVANYLISSLMDGEGKFKHIYIATISSLTPITIIYPIDILLSNCLTLNEKFIFYFLIVVMLLWSGLLLIYNIKEVHNYTVPQVLVNMLLTLFMVIILILVILIIYVMGYQIFSFVKDIIREVIINV